MREAFFGIFVGGGFRAAPVLLPPPLQLRAAAVALSAPRPGMPVPSNAIKSLEEAIGHAVDAANHQKEQLSPDAVVRFVGQHLMRFGTKAASEEPAVVRKLRADVSSASADDVIDALARGDQQVAQLRQHMQSALEEVAWPWLAELAKFLGSDMAAEVAPVRRAQAVAQAVDSAFTAFREPMMALLHDDALGLKAAVGEEAMHEIKVATRITATAAAKVESRVAWTPPALQDDVKESLAKMADAQKAAEGQLREGKDAGAELDALSELLDKEWMPALAARLEKLATDEGIDELHATLPAVARDLLPKFERIYRATGDGIVRQQARPSARPNTHTHLGLSPNHATPLSALTLTLPCFQP